MAPQRKTPTSVKRRASARRSTKRRPQRKSGNGSLASFIVKGVNTLLSIVPGAAIFRPVADFAFKSLGFSKDFVAIGESFTATTFVYGSSAAFTIPLTTLIQDSPFMVRANRSDNLAQKDILTTFTHGKLLHIRVTARPIGQLSYRQGQWALAYLPFSTLESETFYSMNTTIPTLRDVLAIPGAAQASGTRQMSVNYRPRRATFDSMVHPLTTKVGLVMICYEDLSRNKGSEFGPEDFGAEIIIHGAVQLYTPMPHAGWAQFDCKVKDELDQFSIRINEHTLRDARMVPSGDALKVTGTVVRSERTSLLADSSGKIRLGMDAMSLGSPTANELADAQSEA